MRSTKYYAHGALARTVIGENEVEVQNNAYTLQGWIKGMNGQNFSYALGYNNSDYRNFNGDKYVTSVDVATGKDLYNGNIATWTNKNTQLSTTPWTQLFEYDQLNKICYNFRRYNSYKNTYDYDPNGNITALKRYDATGNLFDDLTYNYQNTSSTEKYKENTNKLREVDEPTS